jgi:hypothetical protein
VVLRGHERGEFSDKKPMRLVEDTTTGEGLTFVTYEVARDASSG